MLLDSNIIICAAQPAFKALREWLRSQVYAVSELSSLEVMGYHRLTEKDVVFFDRFFSRCKCFHISKEIVDAAIVLRRTKNMSLGDSVIAATARYYNLKLCTNNQTDFESIDTLSLVDISEFF